MQNIDQLQAWLVEQDLAGIVIYSADEFQNEYVPPSARRLAWATAFTGSVGRAVVMRDQAALFIDGRYTTQAHQQADSAKFEVLTLSPTAAGDWLADKVGEGDRIAVDARLHTGPEVKLIEKAIEPRKAALHFLEDNPVDKLWQDRPALERGPVELYALEFAGKSSEEKRQEIAAKLREENLSAYMVTAPEELAWLLNIRGSDLPATPISLSYALLEADGRATWFLESTRISAEQRAQLDAGIVLVEPAEMLNHLRSNLKNAGKVAINEARTPWHLQSLLEEVAGVVDTKMIEIAKACKNTVELDGARNAQHIDGIAMIKFLSWIDSAIKARQVTELDAAKQVTDFRYESEAMKDISFTPISAGGPNAALAHYSVTEESNRVLNESNMYLLDSGGQYPGGTTDITRTLSLGPATDFQKRCYTLVLKGHIALASARFPEGTTGSQIDVLARQFLWAEGLDYAHGTGHGVGSYLSVHEGPASISSRPIAQPLRAGMIMSNEPGYYLEGKFGIRIENLVIVKAAEQAGFLEFETITEVPLEPELIAPELLSRNEIKWLKDYHQAIKSRYENSFNGEEKAWLLERVAYFQKL